MLFNKCNELGCETERRKTMELKFKRATIDDLDILVETRIQVLRAANQLSEEVDMSEVERQSRMYYKKALSDDTHVAYLVFAEAMLEENGLKKNSSSIKTVAGKELGKSTLNKELFVGAGGISFYRVMPTFHNPTGEKAYIMNMYTLPEYRRQGIASKTLDLLVAEAKKRNIKMISLEATEQGKPLYDKYGFVKMEDEMMFPC